MVYSFHKKKAKQVEVKKCYEVSFSTETMTVEARTKNEAIAKARKTLSMDKLYGDAGLVYVIDGNGDNGGRYYGYASTDAVRKAYIEHIEDKKKRERGEWP